MQEFHYRFPINKDSQYNVRNPSDLFAVHLQEMCRILIPMSGDKELRPDGYRLLNNPNYVYPLFVTEDEKIYEPFSPLDLYEPRVGYIQHLLESLLSLVDLESNGERVDVNAFRLKDMSQWLSHGGGATDIIAHAASRCNLNCRFCYNRSAPPVLNAKPREADVEYRDIRERITHYVPRAGLNIFPCMGSPYEALAHPHIFEILQELRQKTDETFRMSSNGATLTSEMINFLQGIKPVYLDISLNSSSLSRRQWLMNDPDPQIALDSLDRLKKAGIPYAVVIVPWPFPSKEEMIEDLRKTIAFADIFDPTLIQISLPGYSKHISKEELFPHEEIWNDIKETIQGLRSATVAPLVIRPGLFENFNEPKELNDPVVVGAIKNSPVQLAGLCSNDRILKVNGLSVKNLPQARSLLTILHESEMSHATLTIERKSTKIELDLDLTRFDYPYTPDSATHLGAIFCSSGIPEGWIEKVLDTLYLHDAEQVLLLTSALVKPFLENIIRKKGSSPKSNLHISVPQNRYFDGNIVMGDLLVVQDFIDAVKDFIVEEKVYPDLVIIPSSPFHLSGWGRDLTGRVYLDIERHIGIPVVLIECDTIFD